MDRRDYSISLGIIGFSVGFRDRADRNQQSAHDAAATEGRGAPLGDFLLEQKERLLGAILLGNNLVNIMASALATRLFLDLFGETGVVYATLVMTVMVVIFAEVLPKTYAILAPDVTALRVAGPLRVLVILLAL